MKHKRVSNKRIKQMLGEIISEDTAHESHRREGEQGLVEKKSQTSTTDSPGLDIDSENK